MDNHIILFIIVAAVACGDAEREKLENTAKGISDSVKNEITEKALQTEKVKEINQVASDVITIDELLKQNHSAEAARVAEKIDLILETRALSWLVKILAIEGKDGPNTAKVKINEYKKDKDITEIETKALGHIEEYFEFKGDTSTATLLFAVTAFAMEYKYGHAKGVIPAVFAEFSNERDEKLSGKAKDDNLIPEN